MNAKKRVFLLIVIMSSVALGASGAALLVLYDAAFQEERERLIETVRSQTCLMEAMARFDARHSTKDVPGGAFAATLSQVREAHARFAGFGRTGEFILAKREGDHIVFLLRHRHTDLDDPQLTIPFSSKLAEPMRRALSGESGTVVCPDCRGATVLAAYEPVDAIDLGVVAKIDLAEIRAPFLRAGLLAAGIAVLMVLAGAVLFSRVSGPMIERVESRATVLRKEVEERAQAEKALKYSEERYALAQRAAGIGSWDWDITTDELHWSDRIEPMFGFGPGEFGGTYEAFLQSVHPQDRQGVIDSVHACVAEGKDYAIEHRIVFPDGTVRWVSERGDVRRDASGKAVRMFGVVQDITERKAAAEALLQARDDLERRVKERTADLVSANERLRAEMEEHERTDRALRDTQDQLLHSQKMEAIGRLAGGVAHDFNNLMTVITGYANRLLKGERESAPSRAGLEEIKKAGERATVLTRQLLAFSRKQILRPEVLDLNAVAADTARMLRRLLGEDIDLRLTLPPDVGRTRADRVQIEQVLINLAVNARDAMFDGGGLIIETANVDLSEDHVRDHLAPPGPYVMLKVSDTGCGMDEETMSHIFEPFFTTKELGTATGLGLSTAYGIVRQSGGDIRVYSRPGQGTTFKIYLPRLEEAAGGAARPEGRGRPDAGVPRGSETILLVEDEKTVRALTKLELQDMGYTVLEAGTVGEALAVSERHREPIHLLLTDVILPGLSGRRLFEILSKRRPDVKVLYISGHTERHIVHQGVLDPGMTFLAKPFTSEALAAKVREVLDAPRKVEGPS